MATSLLLKYCSILFLFFCVSCSSSQKEEQAFKEVSETLDQSRKYMNDAASASLRDLMDKSNDYSTKEVAGRWLPKAAAIDSISEKSIKQIDSLEQLLTENNYKKLVRLASGIQQHNNNSILETDREISLVFKKAKETTKDPDNYYSYPLAKLFFSKTKHDISQLRSNGIMFCNSKGAYSCGLGSLFKSIIGQSSEVLLPGQNLTITAGMGEFTNRNNPSIKIDGVNIPMDSSPVAERTIKVSKTLGKYSVPVEINYIDESGNKNTNKHKIEYSVAEAIKN